MHAITFRVRRRMRSQWRSTMAFAFAVAVVGATVLTFAAGAARTSSAPDRFAAARATDVDALVVQDSGLSRHDQIAALQSVDGVASMTFMMAALVAQGSDDTADAIVFAGSSETTGATLVAGRDPDPARPHEFVATTTFVEGTGSEIGDTFQFVSLTNEQADRFGFDVGDPQGPSFEATLVGVIEGIQDGDPSRPMEPIAVFPPLVLDEGDIAVRSSVMAVRLGQGADLTTLRADLDTLDQAEQFRAEPIQLVSESVRTAVTAQASGLWVLTAVAAIASIAALGQLATSRARVTDAERSSLAAIGLTSRQIVAESAARAAVPVLAGTVAAVGGASAASSVFPTGFSEAIEPHPGLTFDATVLMVGAVGFALAVVFWTWCALAIGRGRSGVPAVSPVIERLAMASPTAAAATGLRFAYTRTQRESGLARAALWGVLLAAAGIVAAVTVGASLDRLIDDPTRQGRSFDLVFGDAGQTEPSEELRRGLEDDPDIAGLTLLAAGVARTGEVTLPLVGVERIRGDEVLPVLAGRLPSASGEIALGRLTARDLDVGPGDDLRLDGATGTATFRVTGLVVMPSIGGNDGVGEDGLVTIGGLQQLDEAAVGIGLGINLRPGAPSDTIQRILREFDLENAGGTELPEPVRNLERVRVVPYLLAVLLAVLGVLTVAHTMFTSTRRRRRDVAILGALGADGPFVARVVHWQASAFMLAPILVGAPMGLIGGRQVFRWLADGIGVVNDASFPIVLIVGTVVSLVVLANLAAALPARQARRHALAQLLQPE
jgi:hypothetical protein